MAANMLIKSYNLLNTISLNSNNNNNNNNINVLKEIKHLKYDLYNSLIALISSDNCVKVVAFNEQDGTIHPYCEFTGHSDNINAINIVVANERPCIISCSDDKHVVIWDLIEKQGCGEINNNMKVECVTSCNGLVALGHSSIISLYNIINGKCIRQFNDFHTDDIISLQFHPLQHNFLFSASEDGLINQYDLNQADEDEVLISVFSIGQTVENFGFFGNQSQYLYCITTIETLTLWEIEEATEICSFVNLRQTLTQLVGSNVDYLVDCFFDQSTERLFLLAGSNNGTMFIFHVNINELQLVQTLHHGHKDVVRDAIWNSNWLITCGDDGCISIWLASQQ